MAALGRISTKVVEDIHVAVGSVAPVPFRLRETERVVKGNAIDQAIVSRARDVAIKEIHPIDDIRSTAVYRSAVVGNLVAEFLEGLRSSESA
jgi:carbon-monoxide dehydrogenase medium subunit